MVTARSKFLPLLAVVFITLVFIGTSVTAQNPAGIWKFNEGSGDLAYDSSGSGHTASLSSGMNWVKTGNTWAIRSSRTGNGYVTTPTANLSHTKAVTVTLWV